MKSKQLTIVFSCLVILVILSVLFIYLRENISLFSPTRVKNVLVYPEAEESYEKKEPVDLVFYFHGANCDESYMFSPFGAGGLNLTDLKNQYRKDLVFVSFGYDTRLHWSSPSITKDSVRSINDLCKKYNVRKIFFVGISAGGSLALNVLSLADEKLQNRIAGVISVFPIIDYNYTFKHTQRQNILRTLQKHFLKFEDPNLEMELSSPITYISKVPSNTKIILIEGIKDTHIGSIQIEKYYEELVKAGKNAELVKFDVDHLLINIGDEFGKIVKSLLS